MKAWLFGSFFLLLGAPVHAEAPPTKQLESVRSEINSLNQQRALDKKSQSALNEQLRQQSLKVSEINRALRVTENQIQTQEQQLRDLQTQLGVQEAEHDTQLQALYSQLRAAYTHAQPNYLQMLLNQQDPALISRNSAYYRYFHSARQQELEQIDALLANLSEEQKSLFSAQRTLLETREKQASQQQALATETQQRQATLAALDRKIAGQDQQLAELKAQEDALQTLLKRLDKQAQQAAKARAAEVARQAQVQAQSRPSTKPTVKFTGQTGTMPWPLQGKILARFGQPRTLDKLKWRGIMIEAPTGKDVAATAAGTVVFADWLRGFGLLIIVDHGNQFMSLYANNDSLLKAVGETIQAGDIIALSGNRGVRQTAGLYFEVRHKGQPTDPLRWLQRPS